MRLDGTSVKISPSKSILNAEPASNVMMQSLLMDYSPLPELFFLMLPHVDGTVLTAQIHHKRYSFGTDTSSTVDFRINLDDSVTTNGLHDSYLAVSGTNLPDTFLNQPVLSIWLYLWDNTAMALSSDSLSSTAPDLNDWPTSQLLIILGPSNLYRINARLVELWTSGPSTGISPTKNIAPFLEQNYPNPFNPTTTIAFSLTKSGITELKIYDVQGRHVRTLVDKQLDANNHKFVWDGVNASGNSVALGIYFYRLISGDFVKTKKMVILK